MKTTNKSSRTMPKGLPFFLPFLVAGFLLVQSCQKEEQVNSGPLMLKNSVLPYDTPSLYWGHKKLVRSAQKPVVEVITVSGADPGLFEGNLHLKIANGGSGLNMVDNATVRINGKLIVFPGDFDSAPALLTKEIPLPGGDFTLEILLRGAPGSYVDVWIEGKTKPCVDTRDGRSYKTAKIGNQVWMAENLAYLPEVYVPAFSTGAKPMYFVYNYVGTDTDAAKRTENYQTYGVLYNYYAARASCPAGWHLPTDEEWKQLEMKLGMSEAEADITGENRGTDQGLQLKYHSGWAGNGNGTNTSQFCGLPGGTTNGAAFFQLTNQGKWWSATDYGPTAFFRRVGSGYQGVDRSNCPMSYGLSVRCVKD